MKRRSYTHEDREYELEEKCERLYREMLDAVEERAVEQRSDYDDFIDWKLANVDEIEELRMECEHEIEIGVRTREGNSYGLIEAGDRLARWNREIWDAKRAKRAAALA